MHAAMPEITLNDVNWLINIWRRQHGKYFFMCTKIPGLPEGQGWEEHCFTREEVEDEAEEVILKFCKKYRDRNIYFSPVGYTHRQRRAEYACMPTLLWADNDEAPVLHGPKGRQYPSIVIETSPGRWATIWMLELPVDDMLLNKRLTYWMGADKGGWHINKVLRMAATTNYKYKDHPQAKLIKGWWTETHEVKYWTELLEKEVGHITLDGNGGDDMPDIPRMSLAERKKVIARLDKDTRNSILEGKPVKGIRSDVLWSFEKKMYEAGISREDAFGVLWDSPWNKFRDRPQQLWNEIGKAYEGKMDIDELKTSTRGALRRLSYRRLGDRPAQRTEWLIKGIIPKKGIGILYGGWGDAKTWLAIAMALACAQGKEYAGRRTKPCATVYLAADRPKQFQERGQFMASKGEFKKHEESGLDDPPIFWRKTCPPLRDPASVDMLVEMIDRVQEEAWELYGLRVGLVIIDTLIVAAGWEDENSSAEGQKIQQALRALSDDTGTFVLANDHTGKSKSGPRGTSDKAATADVVLKAVLGDAPPGGNRRGHLFVEKVTDGPQGYEIPFKLVTHDVGVDEDGDKETMCTIEWVGDPQAPGAADEQNDDDDVLRVMAELVKPVKAMAITQVLGWTMGNGKPYEMRVNRTLNKRLIPGGFVKHLPGRGYELTKEGWKRVEGKV
jgi:hypothetical protein